MHAHRSRLVVGLYELLTQYVIDFRNKNMFKTFENRAYRHSRSYIIYRMYKTDTKTEWNKTITYAVYEVMCAGRWT